MWLLESLKLHVRICASLYFCWTALAGLVRTSPSPFHLFFGRWQFTHHSNVLMGLGVEKMYHRFCVHFNVLHTPHLNHLRESEEHAWPVYTLGFTMGFLEVPVSRGRGWLLPAPLPWMLHLPCLPVTCALRIVPASSASHRCSFREGPATVLRASGEKAALGQEFFPSKCNVYKCSCEALASSQHRATHLPPLFSLRWEEASPRGICILRWNSWKLQKPAVWGGKKKRS